MKKVLIFGALAGMVTFYACKKDEKTITVTNTVHDTINSVDTVKIFASGKINADSLTAGINLIYGTKVSDATFPAASTDADAPVLDTTYSRTYSVVRSRYLTVYPPNVSGNVAGYYVQIAGAKSYFKVDYPAAEALRKAARKAKAANGRQSSKNINARGNGTGFIDSALVFKLPASVNGDTFYVKYAAYDESNRVSAPVIAMVVLLPVGDAATTAALTGTWRYMFYRNYYNGKSDQDDWELDTTYVDSSYYTCNEGMLSPAEEVTEYHLPYYKSNYHMEYQLGKYSMSDYYTYNQQSLDLDNSSCSNLVYHISYEDDGGGIGGYSYDARSKKITFIHDSKSNFDMSYDTYTLSELTDSYMVLTYIDEESENNNRYASKYVKQK